MHQSKLDECYIGIPQRIDVFQMKNFQTVSVSHNFLTQRLEKIETSLRTIEQAQRHKQQKSLEYPLIHYKKQKYCTIIQ